MPSAKRNICKQRSSGKEVFPILSPSLLTTYNHFAHTRDMFVRFIRSPFFGMIQPIARDFEWLLHVNRASCPGQAALGNGRTVVSNPRVSNQENLTFSVLFGSLR